MIKWRNLPQRYVWSALGIVLWGLSLYLLAAQGIERSDESWFLQVTRRVNGGETLYKDMFFGATPLSIYLLRVLTHVFGLEVLVLKGMAAACITSSILLGARILQELEVSKRISIFFVAANFIFVSSPWPIGLYTLLSPPFLMGTCLAALRWRKQFQSGSKAYKSLIAAGICAGLCFASKQNVGLGAIAALLITVAITSAGIKDRSRSVPYAVALIAFLLVSGVLLAPILLSGAKDKFIEYCFTGKKTYLNLHLAYLMGDVSIRIKGFSAVKVYLSAFIDHPSFTSLRAAIVLSSFFLIPLLATGAIYKLLGKSNRRMTLIVIAFAVAALSMLFPRPSIHHVVSTVPMSMAALFYFWQYMFPQKYKAAVYIQRTTGAALTILVLMYLAIPIKQMSDGQELSQIPHFRGVWISGFKREEFLKDARQLRTVARNHNLFIMGPSASFYYIICDLKNPTPFDYPLVTTFGFHGEEEVKKAILEGRITAVCLPDEDAKLSQFNLTPVGLANLTRSKMDRLMTLNYCKVYERDPNPLP